MMLTEEQKRGERMQGKKKEGRTDPGGIPAAGPG